jgi:hypothetical protein
MQKRLIFPVNALLLVALMSLGDALADNWKKVATSQTGMESYIDYSTIQKNGEYRQAWQKDVWASGYSRHVLVEYDCAKGRARPVAGESAVSVNGKYERFEGNKNSWYYPEPGEPEMIEFRTVCDRWLLW